MPHTSDPLYLQTILASIVTNRQPNFALSHLIENLFKNRKTEVSHFKLKFSKLSLYWTSLWMLHEQRNWIPIPIIGRGSTKETVSFVFRLRISESETNFLEHF